MLCIEKLQGNAIQVYNFFESFDFKSLSDSLPPFYVIKVIKLILIAVLHFWESFDLTKKIFVFYSWPIV